MDGKNEIRKHPDIGFLLKRPLTLTLLIFTAAAIILLISVKAFEIITDQTDDSDDSDKAPIASEDNIPEMNSSYSSEAKYIDIAEFTEDPFKYIDEIDDYSRNIRIIQVYNDESNGTRLTISSIGNKLKAENNAQIIILNEGTLYADYGTHSFANAGNESDFYTTVGITSLDMIREMYSDTDAYESKLTLSDDCLVLTADITDKSADIRMVFEINVESGLVLSERFYYNNTPYRSVITETLNKSFHEKEDFFNIPVK